jgi:hypothetical protein
MLAEHSAEANIGDRNRADRNRAVKPPLATSLASPTPAFAHL